MSFKTLFLTTVLACFGLLGLVLLLSPSASADIGIDELYDEGAKGASGNQFVELFNPSDTPEDLSEYYLSVLQDPAGAGDEYGDYDLANYDDDGWLEEDEFIVVTDEEIDLAAYKRVGIYLKSDNSLVSDTAWSFAGMTLDPVTSWSAQLPYDNDNKEYVFDKWTLARPTRGARNIVPVPNFESYDMVINEVNADYVELYNTGVSTVTLDGYKVAGYRNAYTIPADTELEAGGYYIIPKTSLFIGDNGGDIKLLTELGVLCDVITWGPQGRVADSYVARHIDGLGARGVYQEEDANEGYPDLPNLWWEFEVDDTKKERNYPGTTVFVHNIAEAFGYLNDSGSQYRGGIHQGMVEDIASLPSWDAILYNGTVESDQAEVLTDYLDMGGRLYLEERDFIGLKQDHEELYDMLHIEVKGYAAGAIGSNVLAGELFANDMEFKYNPSAPVNERLDPEYDAFRVMYMKSSPLYRFTAGYIEDATTGYRVISSALQYRDLRADANEPHDFLNAMLDWFTMPDLDHAPEITLLEGQVGSTPLVGDEERISTLGWLGWSNDDPDYWDQDIWKTEDANGHPQYKFMEFTVYFDSDDAKVEDLDEDCLVVATVNTSFYRPQGLEPGQYFWTVRAEDRFGKVGGAEDEWDDPILFSFYYDNVTPEIQSIRPYFKNARGVANIGEEMLGFYETNGYRPTFGPERPGVPEGVLFQAWDEHLGLSFTELEKTELGLRFVSTVPPLEGKTWELGDIGILAKDGTSIDPYNGKNTVEFIMEVPDHVLDDDGVFHSGRYTISYRLVDYVGNYHEDAIIFTVDRDAPDAVTDMLVKEKDHPIYENTGIQYLKAGESYILEGVGPTTKADGTLERIEFVMIDKLFNSTEMVLANFSGDDVTAGTHTKDYAVEFEAVADYDYFYARCYDRSGNYMDSEILSEIIVDAYPPTIPYGIEAEPTGEGYVEVMAWARDSLVSGKTSGMNHVLVYVNGEVVRHESGGTYWDGTPYEPGDEMKVQVVANRFTIEIPLTPINNAEGDIRNVIQVRGVDNVGNVGNLSDQDGLPPIRMLDPQKSLNVEFKEMAFGLSDGVDQLKEMSITMLQFAPGDFDHHIMEMSYHPEQPEVESSLAMEGYWTVETDLTGDYRARVKIVFQHPSISSFDFERLQLATKGETDTHWKVIEDAVFVHQVADPAHGIPETWYVEATVSSFSDFAIVQSRPDLIITDTHIFANPLLGGQWVRISATVRNVGTQATTDKQDVIIRVYFTDEEGAESTIGWIEFQDPIKPGKENEVTGEEVWETPVITDVEKMTFYVKFKVDPNAEIAESDEQNNDAFIDENNDKTVDPVEVLRTLNLAQAEITRPVDDSVIRGVFTIEGTVPTLDYQKTQSPHTHGFRMTIISIEEEISLRSVEFALLDHGDVQVPGERGCVRDIYGLHIQDPGVTVAFDDADRDGKLTAGDTFFMKDLDHGGPAAPGYTLELGHNSALSVMISFDHGERYSVTVSGTETWSYEWDTRTVENGEHRITVWMMDGTKATGKSITVTVDNEKEGEESGGSFLETKLGPLPAYLYLIIMVALMAVVSLVFMRRSSEKTGEARPQPQQEETIPFRPPQLQGGFQGQHYIPPPGSSPPPQLQGPQFQPPPSFQQPGQPQHTSPPPPFQQPPDTWRCLRCGNNIGQEHSFCTSCGNKRQ